MNETDRLVYGARVKARKIREAELAADREALLNNTIPDSASFIGQKLPPITIKKRRSRTALYITLAATGIAAAAALIPSTTYDTSKPSLESLASHSQYMQNTANLSETERDLSISPQSTASAYQIYQTQIMRSFGLKFDGTDYHAIAKEAINEAREWLSKDAEERYKKTIRYKDYIQDVALETGVPEQLIKAVIMVESGGEERKESWAAKGLMQITPARAREYTHLFGHNPDLFDPETNILLGSMILADSINEAYLRDHSESPAIGLIGYNGGMTRMKRWQDANQGTSVWEYLKEFNPQKQKASDLRKETIEYIPRVMAALRYIFQKERGNFPLITEPSNLGPDKQYVQGPKTIQ